jgi:hypothetical protein
MACNSSTSRVYLPCMWEVQNENFTPHSFRVCFSSFTGFWQVQLSNFQPAPRLGFRQCTRVFHAGFYRSGNPIRDAKMPNFPGLARSARNGVPGQMSEGRRPELWDKLWNKLAAFSRPIRVPRTILRHLLCCIREVQHELWGSSSYRLDCFPSQTPQPLQHQCPHWGYWANWAPGTPNQSSTYSLVEV